MDTGKVTRFEVIDDEGRAYVKYGVVVELSLQDDSRTLKVFIKDPELSLCRSCYCMTKTIGGHCGKCKALKHKET